MFARSTRVLLIGALLLTACGKSSSEPSVARGIGASSSWLTQCKADTDCENDYACMCGHCTMPCQRDDECLMQDTAVCRTEGNACTVSTQTCQLPEDGDAPSATGTDAQETAGPTSPDLLLDAGAPRSEGNTGQATEQRIPDQSTTDLVEQIGQLTDAGVPAPPTAATPQLPAQPDDTSVPSTPPPPPATTTCATGVADWKYRTSTGGSLINGVATDLYGDVLVAGWTRDTRTDDPGLMVAKLSGENGSLSWTQSLRTEGTARAQDVVVDATGSAFAVGFTEGSLNGLTAGGGGDAFLAKYTPSGELAWVQLASARGGMDVAVGATVDDEANVIVVGSSRPVLTASPDWFVTKYSNDGDELWTEYLEFGGFASAQGVVSDADGNVTVVGNAPNPDGPGPTDSYIAQWASDGTLSWKKQFGPNGLGAEHIVMDAAGDFYIAGGTYTDLAPPDETGPFVAKLSQEGEMLWLTYRIGDSEDSFTDLEMDANGNLFVSGLLLITDATGATLDLNGLLAKYSPDGEQQWEVIIDEDEQTYSNGLGADSWGHVFVGGWASDELAPADVRDSQAFLIRYE